MVSDGLDGEVALGYAPGVTVLVSLREVALIVARKVAGGEAAPFNINGTPVGGAGISVFVTHPAAAGAAVGEDDAVRVHGQDGAVHAGPVEVAGMVAVQPELGHGSVFLHQVFGCILEAGLVDRGAHPGGLDHAVPGRQVNAQVYAVLVAGISEGLDYVRMVGAAGVGYVRGALGIVPQAKAVVVLGGDDHLLEAVVMRHFHPLVCVDGGGLVVIQQQALAPGFPVAAGVLSVPAAESSLTVVVEHEHLLLLPGQLPGRGKSTVGRRRTGVRRGRVGACDRHLAGRCEPAVGGGHGNFGLTLREGGAGTVLCVGGHDVGVGR